MKFLKLRIVKILHYLHFAFIIALSFLFALRNLRFLLNLQKINNIAISSLVYANFFDKNKQINNEIYENTVEEVQIDSEQNVEKENFENISQKLIKTPFKIIENQFGKSGIKCDNFYVKNITGKDINFDYYLSQNPKIKIKNKKKPLVLIYHTHTTEKYIDQNSKYDNYSTRSQDSCKNVIAVGAEIVKALKNNGINAIHDCTVHDYPEYAGSYKRSAKTIRTLLKNNSEIQIAIDVHRDSICEPKLGKIKPTFTTKNGKKASQIMFISGCGMNKNLRFPNWEKNLILAMNIQRICEKNFPGFTRELFFKNVKYNQDVHPGSLLVEVGSDANTIEESKLSGKMLGESIAIFLKQYMNG